MKNCWPMRQLRPEIGESLTIYFKILIQLYLFYLFLYCLLIVSKGISNVILLVIKFKSVGLWGRYVMKQGNPLQDFKIANQIVFVLSPSLLFHLIYQNSYHRWDLLRLYEYVGLSGRYSLKKGNPLYFFQNTDPVIFVTFISLLFDLLYQRDYQR